MIETILVNDQTGEEKYFKGIVTFSPPWRVKSIKKSVSTLALLATWAQKRGIPVAEASDAARWLLSKDCPYCQLGSQVLKAVKELGASVAEAAFDEILDAKSRGDLNKLEEIRNRLWSLESPELPPQS